jgi:hypothetical protein
MVIWKGRQFNTAEASDLSRRWRLVWPGRLLSGAPVQMFYFFGSIPLRCWDSTRAQAGALTSPGSTSDASLII